MRPLSLKWRMSLLVSAVLIAVVAAISAIAYHELQSWLRESIDQRLETMSDAVLTELHDLAVRETPAGRAKVDREVFAITGNAEHKRSTYYRIWLQGSDEDLVAGDPPTDPFGKLLRQLPASQRPRGSKGSFFSMGQDQTECRIVWKQQWRQEGLVNVAIAFPIEAASGRLGEFLQLLLLVGGGMALGSALVGALVVLWGMRPIDKAAATLHGPGCQPLHDLPLAARRPKSGPPDHRGC